MKRRIPLAIGVALSLSATGAAGQTVHSDDLVILGSVCAGPDCSRYDPFLPGEALRLSENNIRILFESIDARFRLAANESAVNGAEMFAVQIPTSVSATGNLQTTGYPRGAVQPDGRLLLTAGDLGALLASGQFAVVDGLLREDSPVNTVDDPSIPIYLPAGSFTHFTSDFYFVQPATLVENTDGDPIEVSQAGTRYLDAIRLDVAGNEIALGLGAADVVNAVSVGDTGTERRITHVGAGVAPQDIITVGQLAALTGPIAGLVERIGLAETALGSLSGRIDLAGQRLGWLDGQVAATGAIAAALSAMQPNPRRGGLGLSVGLGYHDSVLAVSAGLIVPASDHVLLRGGLVGSTETDVQLTLGGVLQW